MLDENGDNNRPDAEFDATTLMMTMTGHLGLPHQPMPMKDRYTSVAAIPIEPVANDQSRRSATDSFSSGRQSLSGRTSMEWFNGSFLRSDSAIGLPSSRSSESAGGLMKETLHIEAPTAAGNIRDVSLNTKRSLAWSFTPQPEITMRGLYGISR